MWCSLYWDGYIPSCHSRGGPLTGGPKVWAPLLATAFLYVTPPNYRRTEHKSSTLIGEI
jgi:hypothetical protein